MAAETEAEIEARLVVLRAAANAVLVAGQGNSVTQRSTQRANLNDIYKEIRRAEFKLARASSGGAILVDDFSRAGGDE